MNTYQIMVFVIALVIVCLVLLLLALPEKLRKRKAQREDLRRYRDAMADDLMMRVFTDKLDLQDNGLEARKELLRASFAACRDGKFSGRTSQDLAEYLDKN